MNVFIRPTGAPLGQTLGFSPNGSSASLDTAPVETSLIANDLLLAQRAGALIKVPFTSAGVAAGVTSWNGEQGAVTMTAADVAAAQGYTSYPQTNPSGFISTVTLTGDATGTGAGSVAVTLASVGTAGTYSKVTTDAKGRVTAGGAITASDITAALGFAPASAAGGTVSGTWTFSGTVTANAAMLAMLTALVAGLPTTIPSSSGVLWNNGGQVQIS